MYNTIMKLSLNLPSIRSHSKRTSMGTLNKTSYIKSDQSEKESNARISKFLDSSKSKRPLSLDASVCVGNDAKLEFFDTYLNLPLISERNRHEKIEDNPNVAYLGEIEKFHMRPQPFGIVRRKGPNTFIDIHMYSMGDRFAEAFSKGVKQYKEVANLNLRANRLSDQGCARILSEVQSKKIKSITLSENKLGKNTIEKIIEVVSKNECKLRSLELENVSISERAIADLCRYLADNKILRNLNLAKNGLGLVSCLAFKEMLKYNSSIKHLDLHWNNIRSDGASYFFDGLSQNDALTVLDLSWNSLGRDSSLECAKTIGKGLKGNTTLLHLDLSYNYITRPECEVIADLIKENHDLIGLHMTGNECTVDALGFIIPSTFVQTAVQQGHFFNRILEKSKYSNRHHVPSNCWVCEKWVEMKFEWKSVENVTDPSSIHLSIDKFAPTPLIKQKNDLLTVTRVVPPGEVQFFFSNHISAFTSKHFATVTLKKPISNSGTLKEVSIVNACEVRGEECNIKDLFHSRARVNFENPDLKVPEYEKIPWELLTSIFNSYMLTTPEILVESFEFDWSNSKLNQLIKDEMIKEKTKESLKEQYESLVEAYRTLSALSGSEVFAIGSNALNDFLSQGKVFDNLFSLSDLGVNWNVTNSSKDKTSTNNSGNGLCRYEFLEILVRIAIDKYVKTKKCQNTEEAVVKLYKDHLEAVIERYDTKVWRITEYMTEEVDYVLRAYRPLLEHVYKKYSGREVLPGQKPSMNLNEFRSLCNEARLVNEEFTSREIDVCFSRAMMLTTDYLNSRKHLEMTFIEFLEAIARVANELSGNNLKNKLESIMPNLLKVCSPAFIQSYQFPNDETFFSLMYKIKS